MTTFEIIKVDNDEEKDEKSSNGVNQQVPVVGDEEVQAVPSMPAQHQMNENVLDASYIEEVDGHRQGHLLSMSGFTIGVNPATGKPLPQPILFPRFLEMVVAAYLAWRDVNAGTSQILPQLSELLGEDCDFRWTLELRDSFSSAAAASSQLMRIYSRFVARQETQPRLDGDSSQVPFAILGGVNPSVAQTTSSLAGSGMGIVQVTGALGSANMDSAPLFARTIATNDGLARAVMDYLASLNATRVACLFPLDAELAVEMGKDIQQAARKIGVSLTIMGMSRGKIEETVLQLKESNIRYVVAVMADQDIPILTRLANKHGVMGNEHYFWLYPGKAQFASPQFGFPKGLADDIAQSFHGIAAMYGYFPPSPSYHAVYQNWTQSVEQQQEFLSFIPEKERALLQNYTFLPTHLSHPLHLSTYDAVVALGIAACNTPGKFTGQELHRAIKKLHFQGVTGDIMFDGITGTRLGDTTSYQVTNILLSEAKSTNTTHKFDAKTTAIVAGSGAIKVLEDFVYASNNTIPPPPLPPIGHYEYNLMPMGVQALGHCMCGAVVLLSLAFMAWTVLYRKTFVVSASQPIFLLQLCVGTIIMASSIIPSSLQGETPSPQLDAACMAAPWLINLGLVMGMSAILSKTWRIRQLMDGAQNMKRVRVEPMDVAKPFTMLLFWNVGMLLGWTFVSPMRYERVEVNNLDEYGRIIESYGACRATNQWSYLFWLGILAADLCAIIFIGVQCYKVRNMSTYFSETNSMAWSVVSVVESAVIFAPLAVALRDNPSAYYLASSGMVTLICLSFLLPIFVYKIHNRNAEYADAKEDEKRIKEQQQLAVALGEGEGYDSEGESIAGRMSIQRHGGRGSSRKSTFSHFSSTASTTKRSKAKTSGTDMGPSNHSRNGARGPASSASFHG